MKVTILGAGGVRTPLLLQAIFLQDRLGLSELALMDIDGERLDLIGALTDPLERSGSLRFKLTRTTDARVALDSADYVVTTFRVGWIEARIVDERVPLSHGVIGQETTGPGGFAMAMRTLPVLLDYVRLMRELCPNAWLVNFANPSGLLAEAVTRVAGWERAVGICDAPQAMGRVAAAMIGAPPSEVFLDYFGLNHLGWIRAIICNGRDYAPQFIEMIRATGGLPGLPFDPEFIAALGMIPNEYLYYYYNTAQAVQNILKAGQTRGEQIAALNAQLFADLQRLKAEGNPEGMMAAYQAYVHQRGETYMTSETAGAGHNPGKLDPAIAEAISSEGYAGIALGLIETLAGGSPQLMILNVPNRGAIRGMADDDVVEVPAYVGRDFIRPLVVGDIPRHCLGLLQQVKEYERLTIAAAVEGSYTKAAKALALHPLVPDYATAKVILDEYRARHGGLFPALH